MSRARLTSRRAKGPAWPCRRGSEPVDEKRTRSPSQAGSPRVAGAADLVSPTYMIDKTRLARPQSPGAAPVCPATASCFTLAVGNLPAVCRYSAIGWFISALLIAPAVLARTTSIGGNRVKEQPLRWLMVRNGSAAAARILGALFLPAVATSAALTVICLVV